VERGRGGTGESGNDRSRGWCAYSGGRGLDYTYNVSTCVVCAEWRCVGGAACCVLRVAASCCVLRAAFTLVRSKEKERGEEKGENEGERTVQLLEKTKLVLNIFTSSDALCH
jgi:hypothetical protein